MHWVEVEVFICYIYIIHVLLFCFFFPYKLGVQSQHSTVAIKAMALHKSPVVTSWQCWGLNPDHMISNPEP